jgi:hypothetical protein
MIKTLKANIKLAAYNIHRFITKSRTRRHIISKFAEKNDLDYVGYVNQYSDSHDVVRGFTVSQSHQDDHYCVGKIKGCSVTVVDRSDAIWNNSGEIEVQNWTIMAFDLKTKQDLPHFFINASSDNIEPFDVFFRTFPTIHQIDLGVFENYNLDFISRFKMYARPNMAIKLERLMPPNSARVLGAHLWPLSVEQNEHVLYIYSAGQHVTASLLEKMLQNGLWLAAHLDNQAELV